MVTRNNKKNSLQSFQLAYQSYLDFAMNHKHLRSVLSSLIIIIILTSCQRSVSKGPIAIPTSSDHLPFPVSTQPNVMNDILNATSSAIETDTTTDSEDTNGAKLVTTSTPTKVAKAVSPKPTKVVEEHEEPEEPPSKPSTYTLQKGEYPYCIARRFNVDAATLLSINGLWATSIVKPGIVLKIPESSTWNPNQGSRSLKPHPTDYKVFAWDTIYTIACGFGDVDPNDIIAVNGLESPYKLTAGTILHIP